MFMSIGAIFFKNTLPRSTYFRRTINTKSSLELLHEKVIIFWTKNSSVLLLKTNPDINVYILRTKYKCDFLPEKVMIFSNKIGKICENM